MGLGDPTTCVYQFIFDENDSNDTKIIQYFIMHGPSALIARSTIITHEYDNIVIKYMVKSYLYCLAQPSVSSHIVDIPDTNITDSNNVFNR